MTTWCNQMWYLGIWKKYVSKDIASSFYVLKPVFTAVSLHPPLSVGVYHLCAVSHTAWLKYRRMLPRTLGYALLWDLHPLWSCSQGMIFSPWKCTSMCDTHWHQTLQGSPAPEVIVKSAKPRRTVFITPRAREKAGCLHNIQLNCTHPPWVDLCF